MQKSIFTLPTVSLEIPITKPISTLLKTMFNQRIGSVELDINTEQDKQSLIISCLISDTSNKEDNGSQLFTVKDKKEYEHLKKIVSESIDDYYKKQDEKIMQYYKEQEDAEIEEEDFEEEDFLF